MAFLPAIEADNLSYPGPGGGGCTLVQAFTLSSLEWQLYPSVVHITISIVLQVLVLVCDVVYFTFAFLYFTKLKPPY